MNRTISMLLFGLILSSCDPGVSYERVIENTSSHDIWIKLTSDTEPTFQQDSFLIAHNSEQVIARHGSIGRTAEFEDCGMVDSTLIAGINGNDSLMVSNDLNNRSNWVFTVFKETFGGGGECECRLTLSDADIR